MKQALEVNDETLKQLSVCLEATLSPDKQQRKEAEKYLESVEARGNYGLLLLTLLDNGSCNMTLRTAAAVNFKNFVKRNWRILEEETNKISDTDRDAIKKHIVDLMLRSPETLLRQLSDAISIIGREDFPEKWQDLLPKMVEYMKSGNLHNVNGILQTAHSLFKRFRYEFKSQELWTELKFVLDNFAAPLTDLFEGLMAKGKAHLQQPKEIKELKEIFDLLTLTCKIFYSLNYQDLPEYFEDNMKRWMGHFHTILVEEYKALQTDDSEEIGPLERIRSQVCDNVALYAQKYDEEFEPFLPDFVKAIWNLLVSTENKVKYDLLVSNAIQFLASVCERPHYKALFEDHNTLQSICEKVIVPNMEFREADEELFEDNPEEYIRRDIEGSDIDTRRRAACDLVRGLCKFFEGTVINIFSQYVVAMLQMYAKDPANHWKAKDAAIYLVTSLAAKKQTAKHGTTESSQLVNLADFFNNNIAQDLQSANVDEMPVLKADAIKYVITFRSILPRNILLACIPCLVNLLQSKSNVVHSYAASCLERIFTIRTPGGGPPISSAELRTVKEAMLKNLFAALELPGSQENEYVMKGIMRGICVLQEGCLPYAQYIITQLISKLSAVSKNPSKPQFNHYLFEAICALTRALSKGSKEDVSKFEIALFPVIQELLQNDVTEFLPYVFQVLSLLLEIREGGLEGPYIEFFPLLLQPVLWERTGNIPAITRLLQAYVKRGSKQIVQDNKVLSLLGVFQKLIASKANDHEGFYLLASLIEHMEWSGLENHFKQIMIILFQRLQSSKTTKYVKGFLVFICLFAGSKSADMLVSLIDSVQPKLFGMVLEKLFVLDLQKVSGTTERKICAVGITKILTEAQVMLGKDYVQFWVPLLNALIGLFELPEDDSIPDDEHFIEIEDTPGYQTAFTQLMFAGKKEVDPFQKISDPKEFLAKQLYKLSITHPGKLMPLISQGLEQKAAEFLQTYLHKAQVSLA